MNVTQVTVGYGMTYSLPDYANVKPSITLTAEVEGPDAVYNVINDLTRLAKQHVHDQVDEALEEAGQSPKFYTGPLYVVYEWVQRDALVILEESPDGRKSPVTLPGSYRRRMGNPQRYTAVIDRARRMAKPGQEILDVIDEGQAAAVQEWWDSRTWYKALWVQGRDHRLMVCMPHTLVDQAQETWPNHLIQQVWDDGIALSGMERDALVDRLTDDLDVRLADILIVSNLEELAAALEQEEAGETSTVQEYDDEYPHDEADDEPEDEDF